MRKFVFSSILLGCAISFGSVSAQAEVWQMATPYPETNFHTKNVKMFADDVEKGTDGKIQIKIHSAGSLIKHPEIKNAVRSRQIPIGEFFVSILANESPIFALDSVPFVATSFDEAKKLYEASKPELEKELSRQGLKALYSVAWPPQGLYADRDIDNIEDLQGLKFRVYNSQLARFAQLVDAVPAQVEVPDLAQAFTTGRVNTMLTATSTGVDTKAWDYLSNFYDVKAYLPKNIVVVNQRVFDALDEDTQAAVLAAAERAEARGWELAEADHQAKKDVLIENGMKVSDGSDELKNALQKVGVQMAEEWAKEAGPAGIEVMATYKAE